MSSNRAFFAGDEALEALRMELAHVLFIDIVGYSKLLTNEQRELLKELNAIVRGTGSFQSAENAGKLMRLPTGDGMALAFFTTPEAPVRCAVEIAHGLKREPRLHVRMGINSGPVDAVEDVNDRVNVAGAGINFAQRVMDCADAGHILLAKRVADDLAQYAHWKPYLHDLGEVEVKHGVPIALVNFYSEEVGNAQLPSKLQRARKEIARAQRRKLGIIATLLALLITAGWFFFVHRHATVAPLAEKGIAVLPFVNLSDDKANAFFADGMQDEILTDLSKVADLKVISRTSVMQYRDTPTRNLREIAQQLGVAHVLEGSVQRAANRIRISAQLIDARTDAHLWAEHYDRDLADVFAIQSEIATTIVEHLRAKISPKEKMAIEAKPTSDLLAYDLYLHAKQLFHDISTSKDWEGDNRKAVDLLDQAVARDPQFALAYCLLSELNLNLVAWISPPEASARLERAKVAFEQAKRLAPEAGETYRLRSEFYSREGDIDGALDMLTLASKALPGNVDVLLSISDLEARHGHWAEAVRDIEKARELDPKGPNIPNGLTGFYNGLRDYVKSDQVADAAIAAFPNGPGYFIAAKVENALSRGDTEAGRAILATFPKDWDPSGYRSLLKIQVAFAARDFAEASHLIETVNKDNLIPPIARDISFIEALIARKQGNFTKSESILLPLRATWEAKLREKPDDSKLLGNLALIDAYLGHKEDAVREAEKAVELKPISRDAEYGPRRAAVLAQVCMLAGDHERAIQLLSELATIPWGPSYGELLTPWWDDLRGDPRFEKIVASLKPKPAQ